MFTSFLCRYSVIGDTVDLAEELSDRIRTGTLKCASWTAVDHATADSIRPMLACSRQPDGLVVADTEIFVVDPPLSSSLADYAASTAAAGSAAGAASSAAAAAGPSSSSSSTGTAVATATWPTNNSEEDDPSDTDHPSEATYKAQIRHLWAYKRHLMQPEVSPVLRNSEIATQLAAVFRKSLTQRGGKVLARSGTTGSGSNSSSSSSSSNARSPVGGGGGAGAGGSGGGFAAGAGAGEEEGESPTVVIIQGDAGSGKTSLISHCLGVTRIRRSQFVAAFAPAFQRRKRFSTIGNLIRQCVH